MEKPLSESEIREILIRELPRALESDPEIRALIERLMKPSFADKKETEDRFENMLAEIRALRLESERRWEEMRLDSERRWEENQRKWEESQKKWEEMRLDSERRWEEDRLRWEENQRKWEESQKKWEEMRLDSERRWEENQRKWEESQKKWEEMRLDSERRWEEDRLRWEENQRKWEESQKKWEEMRLDSERRWEEDRLRWEENSRHFQQVHEEIMALSRKIDRSIGALGARWGMMSENAYRKGLETILTQNFGVEVHRVEEFDKSGKVFGHPDQVELDVIIHDGVLILCEIKSSMSRADMYSFERKARFYEELHGRRANQLLVISPMVDKTAKQVAEKLGITVCSDVEDVDPQLFEPENS
ncbi:MAG: DUF3782 domain-containing protein [Desulfitobacteriaceae bacterium]|nr:DUF3782 domain-containing protein [Desulfitobacteriaceae bacterium]